MDHTTNISENTPPLHILLPMYGELCNDVFFHIFKNVLARSKLNDSFIDPLKTGMTGKISIDADCIKINWNVLHLESQRIQQSCSMMLGFWAIVNFPSLGKKLFGESWKSPERKSIYVVGKAPMKPEELDELIYKKLKLRIIELNVIQSTFPRLKHFLKAPIDIAKYNEWQISPKMKCFDIQDKYLQDCWDALRRGKFDMNYSINTTVEQPMELSEPLTSSGMESDHEIDREHTVSGANSSHLPKRPRLDRSTDTFGDSTTETFRTMLVEIRKDVGNLTKWLDPTVARHANEECSNSERLATMILKDKDKQIGQMKITAEELQKEIENLKEEKSSLNGQVKSNIDLISALTKGVEANCKLHIKAENDLSASVGLIEKYKETIAQYEHKIGALESEVQLTKNKTMEPELENQFKNLNECLDEAKKMNVKLTTKIGKLEEELVGWKNNAEIKEKELGEAREHLNGWNEYNTRQVSESKIHIENLQKQLSEMTATNEKLEQDLVGCKINNEKELETAKNINKMKTDDINKLEEQLNALNNKVASIVPEFQRQIEILDKNLNEMTAKNRKLEEELVGWKNSVAAKEKELETAKNINKMKTDDISKLEEQLNALHNKVASIVPEFQRQIEILNKNLNEMTAKNGTLKKELHGLNELIEAKKMDEMKSDEKQNLEQIEHLQKQLSEMTKKNEKLEGEMIKLKHNAMKGKKIEKLKNRAANSGENTELKKLLSDRRKNSTSKNKKIQPTKKLNKKSVLANEADDPEKSIETLGNCDISEEFHTDDPIVKKCRPILLKLQFGWIKFYETKNCVPIPGFVHPPDEDGKRRAQSVTADGYVSDAKNLYVHYSENIPQEEKDQLQLSYLNKLNEKFGFSLV